MKLPPLFPLSEEKNTPDMALLSWLTLFLPVYLGFSGVAKYYAQEGTPATLAVAFLAVMLLTFVSVVAGIHVGSRLDGTRWEALFYPPIGITYIVFLCCWRRPGEAGCADVMYVRSGRDCSVRFCRIHPALSAGCLGVEYHARSPCQTLGRCFPVYRSGDGRHVLALHPESVAR